MVEQSIPEMKEDGDCPYCGGPTVNVAFEFITCGAAWNKDCFGHQVRTPIDAEAGLANLEDAKLHCAKPRRVG